VLRLLLVVVASAMASAMPYIMATGTESNAIRDRESQVWSRLPRHEVMGGEPLRGSAILAGVPIPIEYGPPPPLLLRPETVSLAVERMSIDPARGVWADHALLPRGSAAIGLSKCSPGEDLTTMPACGPGRSHGPASLRAELRSERPISVLNIRTHADRASENDPRTGRPVTVGCGGRWIQFGHSRILLPEGD
jgi:hypothetical protein